jgi:hypothetical protein
MENNIDIKYDANGDIDINYYIHEAEVKRAQYLRELAIEFKAWLHESAHKLAEKLFSHHRHLPH